MTLSYWSIVTSVIGVASPMPATFNTASTRPNCSIAVSNMAATSSSLVTSQWTGSTPSPTSAAVSFSAPLMSAATTLAPSRTNTFVEAFAMPDPAPVMTATLPLSNPMTPPSCQVTCRSILLVAVVSDTRPRHLVSTR